VPLASDGDLAKDFWVHDIESDTLSDLNTNLIVLGVQFVQHLERDASTVTEVASEA
jgi:hypothetical protein